MSCSDFESFVVCECLCLGVMVLVVCRVVYFVVGVLLLFFVVVVVKFFLLFVCF